MKKSRNNAWKRVAAGALSMALVAGIMPANVGGFLTGGNGIVAHAEDHAKADLSALRDNVNEWLGTITQDQIAQDDVTYDEILRQTDRNTYRALNIALNNAESVLNNSEATQDIINHTYDMLYSAYIDAQKALNATPITGEDFLNLAENGAITLQGDYRITDQLVDISFVELDLNGHALYMGDNELRVPQEATLTVEDSSETGLLVSNSNVLFNMGTVNIDGGTIKGVITNMGSSTEGDPDVTMNINRGVINGRIYNFYASAKLNISGGEIGLNQEEALKNREGVVSVTGGKFNFNPSEFVADGYQAVMDEESNIYEVSEITPFTVETDDSIYDGCDINLYAQAGQSFETTITLKKDEAFTKEDALSYLGIDEAYPIDVKNYEYNNEGDITNLENAPTFATIAVTAGDVTENDGTFKLDITFTVSLVNASTNETPDYLTGNGSVVIGDMTVNVNVANPVAASEEAEIAASGLTALSFTYNENNEEVTESYTKRQLSKIVGGIAIPAESAVTLTTEHKSWFTYNDGFVLEIADINEAKNADGTYTYTFIMPAYDVDHDFVMNGLNFNEFNDSEYDAQLAPYSGDTNAEKAADVWNKAITAGDAKAFDEENEYYADTEVTVTSPLRLMFGYTDKDGKYVDIDANEQTVQAQINPSQIQVENPGVPSGLSSNMQPSTLYKYSFVMPAYEVDVKPYTHEHDYKFTVDGNKLIRTCLHKDNACGEGNEDVTIAELKTAAVTDNNTFVYDRSAKSAVVDVAQGVDVVPGVISYSTADAFGDAVEGLQAAPSDAGKYLAESQVWYDINGNTLRENDELFDLALNYKINPFELTAENIKINDDQYNHESEVTVFANEENSGKFTGPKVTVSLDNMSPLREGVDGEYVITGTSNAKEAGDYELTVQGVGNYTGAVDIPWTLSIQSTKIEKEKFTVNTIYKNGFAEADIFYGGSRIDNNGFAVSSPTVVNEGGTYKLTIDGIGGGYYGSVDLDWVVDEFELSKKYADMKKVTYLNDDKSRLEFRANMTVPEGATMTKIGLFATKNPEEKYKLNFTDTPVQNDDIYVKEYTTDLASKTTSSYTWRKTYVENGTTWYAVPYVCYTLNGKDVTVYGDLIEATVQQNNKASYKAVELGQAKFKSSSYNATDKKLEFVNRMIVPEGCTMTAIGICATNNKDKAADLSINTAAVDGETYIKKYTTDLEGKTASNYTWRKTKVEAGATWYVKPYVTYTDESGATYTAYGTLETVTAAVAETAPVLE